MNETNLTAWDKIAELIITKRILEWRLSDKSAQETAHDLILELKIEGVKYIQQTMKEKFKNAPIDVENINDSDKKNLLS